MQHPFRNTYNHPDTILSHALLQSICILSIPHAFACSRQKSLGRIARYVHSSSKKIWPRFIILGSCKADFAVNFAINVLQSKFLFNALFYSACSLHDLFSFFTLYSAYCASLSCCIYELDGRSSYLNWLQKGFPVIATTRNEHPSCFACQNHLLSPWLFSTNEHISHLNCSTPLGIEGHFHGAVAQSVYETAPSLGFRIYSHGLSAHFSIFFRALSLLGSTSVTAIWYGIIETIHDEPIINTSQCITS